MASTPGSRGGKRPGAGRKKKYSQEPMWRVRLPKELIERCDHIATLQVMSRTEVIVTLLEASLSNYEAPARNR